MLSAFSFFFVISLFIPYSLVEALFFFVLFSVFQQIALCGCCYFLFVVGRGCPHRRRARSVFVYPYALSILCCAAQMLESRAAFFCACRGRFCELFSSYAFSFYCLLRYFLAVVTILYYGKPSVSNQNQRIPVRLTQSALYDP